MTDSKLEPIAANVCAAVFDHRPSEGRFVMRMTELLKATALPFDELEAATAWAAERGWLRRAPNTVELTASGIYIAKETLDLPR